MHCEFLLEDIYGYFDAGLGLTVGRFYLFSLDGGLGSQWLLSLLFEPYVCD